jgi:hypothetical protein
LITRGYFRRQHPHWEQARLVAYSAAHAMGGKRQPPKITNWLPFPWEKSEAKLPDKDWVENERKRLKKMNLKNLKAKGKN